MEDSHVHALDYLNVFRRRKYWLIAPVAASIVVGLVLLKVLPKEYRSTATIGVRAPAVSPAIVYQTSLDNQERLRALQQQMMSGPILTRVAREEGLGTDARVVDSLRGRIHVTVPDPVATVNEPRRLDTFLVSYSAADPSRAQQIANRLVNVFVDESSTLRTEHAEDTSMFLASQQQASQERLSTLEAQLRQAKESHMGRLPEQTAANLSTLSGLRQQLEANSTALRGEQDRLSMIEKQIDGMNQGSADAPLLLRNGDLTQAQSPETRVMALERQLADARITFKDLHPEVQRLQEELKAARAEAASDKAKPASARQEQLQLDPAYRQLTADREMARLRIRDLQRSESDIRGQIGSYQARVEAAPMVEQQLSSLQREYDMEKRQYEELNGKLHTANIAESVARNRGGEQFAVLEGASFPTVPISPIPWRVMLLSIVAGLCLGGAATFGREYLDRSVHDVREIKDEFDLPVLGEVARIQPA